MRKLLVFLLFFPVTGLLHAQETDTRLAQGSELTINAPKGERYAYLAFPRKHTIIKRGAIADFNALAGEKVVISEIYTNNAGVTYAQIRRKDGHSFFRFYPTVTVRLDDALANGELIRS